jgi:hypothetical protein
MEDHRRSRKENVGAAQPSIFDAPKKLRSVFIGECWQRELQPCFQLLADSVAISARTAPPAADHSCSSTYWLSRLRRLHARGGTALRSSTSPTFSTTHSLMRRMSPQLQPQPPHVLRHAHRRYASTNLWHQQNHLNYHPQLTQDHGYPRSPQSRQLAAIR